MRKLLTILSLLTAFVVKGQPITYTPMTQAGYGFKYEKQDSGNAMPFRNLSLGRGTNRPGPVVVNIADTGFYYYNGVQFIRLDNKVDSVTSAGNNVCQWKNGQPTCYLITGGSTFYAVDSLTYSGNSLCWWKQGAPTCYSLFPGVDSVTVHDSTLCQWQGGVSTCYIIHGNVLGSFVDSITVIGDQLCQWKSGVSTCFTINTTSSGGVDSITVHNDTLCQWKAGNSTCWGLKDTVDVGYGLGVNFQPNGRQQIFAIHPNGYEGGIVTWDSLLTYTVSPSTVFYNNEIFIFPSVNLTIDPPNSQPRYDVFAIDTLGPFILKGDSATVPVIPQVNGSDTFALTSGFLINPGDTIPNNFQSANVWDENLGVPTELALSTTGTITQNPNNTDNPKHLTKAIFVSKYNNGSSLKFLSASTDTVKNGQVLSFWIYLNGSLNTNYLRISFLHGTTAVTNSLNLRNIFGLNPNDSNVYQQVAIPLSVFNWTGGNVFDGIRIQNVGTDTSGAKGYYLDWITLQTGVYPIPSPTDYSNKADSAGTYKINDSTYITKTWVKGVGFVVGDTIHIHSTGGGGGSGTVTSIATSAPITGGTITTTGTIGITAMNATTNGYVTAGGSVNKILHGDGTWKDTTAAGTGTVTSIATGYGLSGGTITTTGTIIVDSATLHTKFMAFSDTAAMLFPYQQKSPKYINIMITGQSNAWGGSGPTAWDTARNSRVLIWQHAQATPAWVTATINQRPFRTLGYNSVDGGGTRDYLNGSSNSAFYLAKKLAKENPFDTIRIIMAIGDGQNSSFWFNGATRGRYTDSLINRGNASGIDHVDLLIVDQGESDAATSEGNFISRWDSVENTLRRQAWFNPTTPIVFSGLPLLAIPSTFYAKDTTLQKRDYNSDDWDGYANTLGLSIATDSVHFSGGSLDTLGSQYYYAAWKALPERYLERNKNLLGGSTTPTIDLTLDYPWTGYHSFSPSKSAVSGIVRGMYIKPTLTATAGLDTLIALDINPTFVPGAFSVTKGFIRLGRKQIINADTLYNFNIGTGNAAMPSGGNVIAIGNNAGVGAGASSSVYLGSFAGSGAGASTYSMFVGSGAGANATNADHSVFIGLNTALNATNANNSNFFGQGAGVSATAANNSIFIGAFAGNSATSAANSIFMGANAGQSATSAANSIFMGLSSGYNTKGANNTFLGYATGNNSTHTVTGANNILIGTNITTPSPAAANSANFGGVLYLAGTYGTTTGTPKYQSQTTGQVGINTAVPATPAVLDIQSTTGVMLPPRMTQAQRDSITLSTSISRIILTPGSGYTGGTYTISFSGGGGSGAAGTVTVAGTGYFSSSITNYGTGYTSAPTATISAGGGTGGSITVIIPELRGSTIYCTDCTATDASTGVMQTWNGTTWKNNW